MRHRRQVAPGATVHGAVARHDPPRLGLWPAPFGGLLGSGAAAIGWLRGLVGLGLLGLAFVALAPGYSRRTADTLGRSPWLSLRLGAAALLGIPLAALAAFGIGLVVGGWWVALLALALYVLALALGLAAGGLFVGCWLLARG